MSVRSLLAVSVAAFLATATLFVGRYPAAVPEAAAQSAGPVLFDDFSAGVGPWGRIGNVASATVNGNTILRFTPAAGSSAEASKNTAVSLAPYAGIRLSVRVTGANLLGGDASALFLD